MPDISFYNPISYIGFILIIIGLFLVLTGFDIVKLASITVRTGRVTCIVGFLAIIVGGGLLVNSEQSSPEIVSSGIPTEQPETAQIGVTPTLIALRAAEDESTFQDPIPCSETKELVGTRVSCKLSRAYCSYEATATGSPTFCGDAPYPDQSFSMVVWGEDWSDYDGKCIVINGVVGTYAGKPEIKATYRSQISSCP